MAVVTVVVLVLLLAAVQAGMGVKVVMVAQQTLMVLPVWAAAAVVALAGMLAVPLILKQVLAAAV
jgi:hypothetical protein